MTEENNSRVVVLTPDPSRLTADALMRRFVLYIRTRKMLSWLNTTSLPNILEMFGLGSGGGPPGFSVLETTPAIKKAESMTYIMGFVPGAEIITSGAGFHLGGHMGTTTSAGVVINYMQLIPQHGEPDLLFGELESIQAFFDEQGYELIPLIEYNTPQAILDRVTNNAQVPTK